MIEVMANPSSLHETQARFLERRTHGDPAWLQKIRAHALAEFSRRGYPTTKDEEWKFTSVAPIAKGNFHLPTEHASVNREQVEAFAIQGLKPHAQLVFVNGRFAPGLSTSGPNIKGVRITPLAKALTADPTLVKTHVQGHELHTAKADAFAWMNTAFVDDGVVVVIEENVTVEATIEVLSIAAPSNTPLMSHPRNIIVADESAEVTVVERYVALEGAGTYFTNAVTDVVAGPNAKVHHYLLEEEGGEGLNVSTLRTRQLCDSNVDSHTILLGGKLVRNNVHAILDGAGAQCLINGLYIGSDQQHMDNHMRVEHVQPHGDSRQFYKGILDDRASGVFSGRIIVHPGAQKTDAKQTNKNLLLSQEAHVDTRPQLEIYADDVKCTHGATIGQLDEQAIFYCRARGISNDAARSMLIHAFAAESLTRMQNPAIRAYIDAILFARLPGGDLLEHML